MDKLPEGLRVFEIQDPPPACGRWRENMPSAREAGSFKKYIEARKLWRSKIEWKLTKEETTRILADVMAAADSGDWGALALLAHFYREGLGPLPENNVLQPDADKAVAITRLAVSARQPWGFYDLGVAHEYGYGGANQSNTLAWAYYLRAAELGSPEAQLVLAAAYRQANRLLDEEEMLHCAFLQGHGPAAGKLGLRLMVREKFAEGVKVYHDGVKYGCEDCAFELRIIFEEGAWLDASEDKKRAFENAGFSVDLERSRRYQIIADALKINPDLKFTMLDSISPLPSATLPEWTDIEAGFEPENATEPSYK